MTNFFTAAYNTAKDIEKQFLESNDNIIAYEVDIQYARYGDCTHLIPDAFWEERDEEYERRWELYKKLENCYNAGYEPSPEAQELMDEMRRYQRIADGYEEDELPF